MEGLLLCSLVVPAVASLSQAESATIEKKNDTDSIRQREALTNGFFGIGDELADSGIEFGLGVTNIYRQNVHVCETFHLRFGEMDITGGFEHHGCPVAFDYSIYANDEVTQCLNISPNIQYVANPGGNGTDTDAVVLGLRAQMSF